MCGKKRFPIVGIGGSAGGLEAFQSLLKNMSDKPGAALVFIMHLAPDHKSLLPELLARMTKMPVSEITNGMRIEINHVYVKPPNSNLVLSGGKLTLTALKYEDAKRMPIDFFFQSLSDELGPRSIGVVLSGTATDGTLGAEAIKASGGIIFAQDEKTAKFNDMPKSAISAGCVDFVLSPKKISDELVRIANHPLILFAAPVQPDKPVFAEGKGFGSVFDIVRRAMGLDFTYYKTATVSRRVSRRIVLTKQESLKNYIKLLRENRDEVRLLYEDLLINVTSFFRDPKAFNTLEKSVIPKILKNKTKDLGVRIWVPGCSSGEEVYSIAMLITEALGRKAGVIPVSIFATDMSDVAIGKARRGVYGQSVKDGVTKARLKRFFAKEGNSYKISKGVREMCIFSKQNVFSDPPFSNIDLISCRNLLIYLQPNLQKKVFHNFHYSLAPGGFLMLGSSESISGYIDLFKELDRKQRIFEKKYTPIRRGIEFGQRYYPENKLEVKRDAGLGAGKAARLEYPERRSRGIPLKGRFVKKDEYNKDLQKELKEVKEYLQAVIEAQESANEEVRTANEEMLSSNEELQSTNEELETAKEELQSSNEELTTTNEELQNRNAEVSLLNNDLINLLSSISIPVIMLSSDLVIRRVTPQADKVLNIISSDVGRSISRIKLNIDIPDFEETIQDVIESLNPKTFEVEDKEGNWYSVYIRPYRTMDNKIDGVVVIFIDITRAKAQEKKIESALHYANNIIATIREPLLVLDKNLRVIIVNHSFCTTFKVREEETVGKYLSSLGNGQWDIAGLRRLLIEILPGQLTVENYEIEHDFNTIGHRIMSLNARQLRVPKETPSGSQTGTAAEEDLIVLAIEDITEERRLLEEKNHFMNMVSHELRTPLSAIKESISLIAEDRVGPIGEEQREMVDIAKRNVDRLSRLINDVLSIQKIDGGKMEFKPDENDMNETIREAHATMMPLAAKKGVSLTLLLDDTLPRVKFDKDRIVEVLINLVDNAIRFTEKGGITLASERGDNFIRVSVKDAGPGIKKGDIPRLFKRFAQLERRPGGTGLGLSIAKEMIDMHGGEMAVESEGGNGSTFYFTLPV